jgi:hypothetical protein
VSGGAAAAGQATHDRLVEHAGAVQHVHDGAAEDARNLVRANGKVVRLLRVGGHEHDEPQVLDRQHVGKVRAQG